MGNVVMGRNVLLYRQVRKSLSWSKFLCCSSAVPPLTYIHLSAFNSLWQQAMEKSEMVVTLWPSLSQCLTWQNSHLMLT